MSSGTAPCANPWWRWLARQTRRSDQVGRFARYTISRHVPVRLSGGDQWTCDRIAEHLRAGDDWQALCDGYGIAKVEYADVALRRPRWAP